MCGPGPFTDENITGDNQRCSAGIEYCQEWRNNGNEVHRRNGLQVQTPYGLKLGCDRPGVMGRRKRGDNLDSRAHKKDGTGVRHQVVVRAHILFFKKHGTELIGEDTGFFLSRRDANEIIVK